MGVPVISVLVVGKPDYGLSVDLALAARAFGAQQIVFTMPRSTRLERYFRSIASKWGGAFEVLFTSDWAGFIRERRNYKSVYLTQFGLPYPKVAPIVKTYKNLIVVISTDGAKSIVGRTDFNVSISTQPHVTISALAIFLHEFYSGRELAMHFENARYKVVPSARSMKMKSMNRIRSARK